MSDPNQPPRYTGGDLPQHPGGEVPQYPPPYAQYPPPQYGQPQYGQPQYGQPQYGQPQYGQPQYGQPQYPPPYGYQGYGPPAEAYAHWGKRVAATLLDALLLVPGYIVAVIGVFMASEPAQTTDTKNFGIALAVLGYGILFVFSIWNGIIRQGRTGSSLGKQWLGIRVISEKTGLPIGGWATLGRSFVHILDGLACYVGYLWPLWDDKRQTFADKIMTTIVVPAPPKTQ